MRNCQTRNEQRLNLSGKEISSRDSSDIEGILLVDKPSGKTAFSLVSVLRRYLGVRKIGHAGTLDPFATGVMVMLIGKNYTRLSDQLLCQDKEYLTEAHLGITTDSYDCDGAITSESPLIPTLEEIKEALKNFQGEVEQIPPMFSAKKINGKKLCDLARKGKVIERRPAKVTIAVHVISYNYPKLILRISCSKGTYIRSLAHDLGTVLGCGAHLTALQRLRSGNFHLNDCLSGSKLMNQEMEKSTILEKMRQK